MSASNPFVKGGRYGHLIENIIQSNAWPARESALKLYTKICQNILNNPTEPKFRKINVEKVIAKFGTDFKGIAELLKQGQLGRQPASGSALAAYNLCLINLIPHSYFLLLLSFCSVGFIADGGNLILPDSSSTDLLAQSLAVWSDREAKSAAGRAEAERIRQENMKVKTNDAELATREKGSYL